MGTDSRRADRPGRTSRPFAQAWHHVFSRARHAPLESVGSRVEPPPPTLDERAAELNAALYKEVEGIPPVELARLVARLDAFGRAREYSNPYREAWLLHAERLYLTFAKIRALLPTLPSRPGELVGLECGHASVFTDVLIEDVSEVRWKTHVGDLRYPWEVEEGSADVIVCTEVLEHLSDPPVEFQPEFRAVGLKAALKQVRRALKPGGAFLATTPNVASMLHYRLLVEGASPWFDGPHVREYTIFQLVEEMEKAGLEIVEAKSVHCMSSPDRYDYTKHFRSILELGGYAEHRGDDLFLTATRPH